MTKSIFQIAVCDDEPVDKNEISTMTEYPLNIICVLRLVEKKKRNVQKKIFLKKC